LNYRSDQDSEGEEGREGEASSGRLSSSKLSFSKLNLNQSGIFATFFVFVDLPKHIEFRSQDLPILKEGTFMDFNISIRNPKDPKKVRKIEGLHLVSRSILKYGGKRPGLTQYLEWKSVK